MSAILQAKERKDFKRSALKAIRTNGNVPAIIYGSKVENQSIFVNSSELTKTLREVGRNGVISLDVEGKTQDVVLTDYQQDCINNELRHVDFLAVDKTSKITVDVRLVLVGDCTGVRDGGVLQQPVHELSITATPDQIPQQIEVGVENLQVGETLAIADILYQGTFTINHDNDVVIASVLPPKVEEEINAGEEQEAGHPDNEEGRETAPVGEK